MPFAEPLTQGSRVYPGMAGTCRGQSRWDGWDGSPRHWGRLGGSTQLWAELQKLRIHLPASKPESAWGSLMTHGTPEIIFMGIDP